MKCDETRPSCNRCITSRRRCDGYLPANILVTRRRLADLVRQTASLGPAAVSIAPILRQSPEPPACTLDSLFFDVFRHATGPGTALLLPSLFWTQDLPQMAHAESAIWHATLALGALHRQWEADRGLSRTVAPTDDVFKRAAYRHYMRAISLAKSITSAPTLRALSVVLVAVSNLLGRWSDSRTHLFGGLRLLDHEHKGEADIDGAAEILGRLDLQAMTFSDSNAPYPFESPVWLRSLHKKLLGAETIDSYGRAGTLLLVLLRRFILLCVNTHDGGAEPGPMYAGKAKLTEELEAWEAKMAVFERTFLEDIPALSVRIFHAQLRLWLTRGFDGDEMWWDTDESLFYFEYIVNLAEKLLGKLNTKSSNKLSLEPAVIVPLFSAAHRCRHPHLRRRAIKILSGCKRQEGMWPSDGAAAVAARIADAEEGRLDPGSGNEGATAQPSHDSPRLTCVPSIPWDTWSSGTELKARNVTWDNVDVPPRSRRVKDVLVEVSAEKKRVNITLLFIRGEEMVTEEDTIIF